jgi:hypothetical protein
MIRASALLAITASLSTRNRRSSPRAALSSTSSWERSSVRNSPARTFDQVRVELAPADLGQEAEVAEVDAEDGDAPRVRLRATESMVPSPPRTTTRS